MCLCESVHVHGCVCVFVMVHSFMHMNVEPMLGFSLHCSLLLFFETGSLTKPELTILSRLAGQRVLNRNFLQDKTFQLGEKCLKIQVFEREVKCVIIQESSLSSQSGQSQRVQEVPKPDKI